MTKPTHTTFPVSNKNRFWFAFIAAIVGFGYSVVLGGYIWRGVFVVQVTGFILFLGGVFAWFIMRGIIRRDRFLSTGLELGFGLSLLVLMLALFASSNPEQGIWRVSWLVGYLLFFYMLVNLFSVGFNRWGALAGLIVIVGLALAQAVGETFLWYQDWFRTIGSFRLPPVQYRFIGLFSASGPLMGLANLFLPILLLTVTRCRNSKMRIAALVWLYLYALALPFSSSRSAWMGCAVALAIWGGYLVWKKRVLHAFWRWPHRKIVFLTVIILLLAVITGWLAFKFYLVFASHPSHGNAPFGMSGRETFWANALKIWRLSPWLGAGPGRFGFAYLTVQTEIPPAFWPMGAHSLFFQILAEFGMLGCLAFVFLVVQLTIHGLRRFRLIPSMYRPWIVALLAGLAGGFAQMFFDNFSSWISVMLPVVFILAWVWTLPPTLPANRKVALTWLMFPTVVLVIMAGFQIWAYQPFSGWQKAAREGDWFQAANLASQSARRDPRFSFYQTEAGLLWAWEWHYNGDPQGLENAREYLNRSLDVEAAPSWLWANLAVLDNFAHESQSALTKFNIAISLSPKVPAYPLNRGAIYEQLGTQDLAIADYLKTLRLAPDWVTSPFWDTTPIRQQARQIFLSEGIKRNFSSVAHEFDIALSTRQFGEANRLLADARILGETDFSIETRQSWLYTAMGDGLSAHQQNEKIITRMDQKRFNLYPEINFYYENMVSNRNGIGISLVPGFLHLEPDEGQLELLQGELKNRISNGECSSALSLFALQQDVIHGYALDYPKPTFSCR